MGEYMKNRIIAKAKISIEEGQEQYKAYFKTALYKKWQTEVDEKLKAEGFEACIVTE